MRRTRWALLGAGLEAPRRCANQKSDELPPKVVARLEAGSGLCFSGVVASGLVWPFAFVTCGCPLCYSRKGNEPHVAKQGARKCGQGHWVSWCS